jgi:hypothetical protein
MRYLYLLVIMFSLMGCQYQHSVEYYFTHVEALKRSLLYCQALSYHEAKNNRQCLNAVIAYERITELSASYFNEHDKYGEIILRLQMKVSNLEAQIKKRFSNRGERSQPALQSLASLQSSLNQAKEKLHAMTFIVAQYVRP